SHLRDEAAERRLAQELRAAGALSRLHAVQRVPARPLHLPVLRRRQGPHLRSSRAPLARRAHALGERGHGLRAVQPDEGRQAARRGAHAPGAEALPAHGVRAAPQRPAVPAELPARELARLSLLGYRARAVSNQSAGAPKPNWSITSSSVPAAVLLTAFVSAAGRPNRRSG